MREMMKMAAISTVTALLLCSSIFATADSLSGCELYAAKDSNSEVPLLHPLKSTERLIWKLGNKVIFDRRGNQVIEGKNEDVSENGTLKVPNVDNTKKGEYTVEVFRDGKRIYIKSMTLCLMDSVKKPTVKMDCKTSSVKFTCKTEQAEDVKIEWLQNNKVLEKVTTAILILQQDDKRWVDVQTDSFRCKVSNHVSHMSSDPVKQTCIKPTPDLSQEVFGINIWILVGSGGGVVLLLIIIIIVCCCRNRRKKRMQVKDEEELRLGWTNPNQQHHHHHHHQQHNHPPDQHPHQHHHHHHQQQPAGHTGPRHHRPKQQRNQQRPRAPDVPNGHPQPSPRRPAQGPRPVDNGDEQPPPLPQPRKKAPKTPRE